MSHKPDLQSVKSANGERKRRETAIHRIIDRHKPGWNDKECMTEIRKVLHRGVKARGEDFAPRSMILNGKEA